MKIGVGICTYNRPSALAVCLEGCRKYDQPAFDLYVADDGSSPEAYAEILRLKEIYGFDLNEKHRERVGNVNNKNRILHRFEDYDIIIILEDDAFPNAADWISTHIAMYQISNIHHFSHPYKDNWGKIYKRIDYAGLPSILNHQHTDATFQFFTCFVLKVCGGFDSRFGLYGWGHMEYSGRIGSAGLMFLPGYASLSNIEELIGDQKIDSVLDPETRKEQMEINMKVWKQAENERVLYREFRHGY